MSQASSAAILVVFAATFLACGAGSTSAQGPSAAADADGAKAHVRVHELRGSEDRDLDPVLSPALHRQLETCHGSAGGKLRVRVRRDGERLSFEAEPAHSFFATTPSATGRPVGNIRAREDTGSYGFLHA